MLRISHTSISGINRIFKGKERVRKKIIMVPAAVCCKKWLNYASSFPLLLEKNEISNNLSKLKDKLVPGVYQMFDSGLCRKGYQIGAERGDADEARAPAGRRARGGYAPRGSVQPLVDGSLHQEEAGRRAKRWAVGRRDGTRQAPRTSTRGRSRAGPGRSGGGRVCAAVAPSEPVLGKKTALSRESRQSGSAQGARRRGVGAGPGLANARGLAAPGGARLEGRLGATGGGRGWGAAGSGRRTGASGVDDGVSGLLPRSAPSLRITHAGGGGRRERGGQGAERTGPRARGRSGPRAPCGPREPPGAGPGRRGPPAGGSARRRRNAEACHAGREAEGEEGKSWKAGLGGALVPHRRLEGARARAAARRVFTFPLVERQCRHLSASARHFRRRGSGSGCGSGVGGRALPRPRGPTFKPATPAGPTERIRRPDAALRPWPDAVSRVASPSGLGTPGGACPLAGVSLRLYKRWVQATAGAPTLDKVEGWDAGKMSFCTLNATVGVGESATTWRKPCPSYLFYKIDYFCAK